MELSELIEQARQEKKWLELDSYLQDDLSFSPDELEEFNKKGQFRWGVINWKLVEPERLVKRITFQIAELVDKRVQLLKRMEKCS